MFTLEMGIIRYDLDLASTLNVKLLDGRDGSACPHRRWEPEEAFTALAELFSER